MSFQDILHCCLNKATCGGAESLIEVPQYYFRVVHCFSSHPDSIVDQWFMNVDVSSADVL